MHVSHIIAATGRARTSIGTNASNTWNELTYFSKQKAFRHQRIPKFRMTTTASLSI